MIESQKLGYTAGKQVNDAIVPANTDMLIEFTYYA